MLLFNKKPETDDKEAAIAEYRKKRDLTLREFFNIAQLPFPERYAELADRIISDFTADPRRLTENSVYMFWRKYPYSIGKAEDALEMAVNSNCLFIITNTECDFPRQLFYPDRNKQGHSLIREAYIRASHYIRSIHKAKVIAVTGSVGKTSMKEIIEAVLRTHYQKPLVSKGNNNSTFSITKNIQSLRRVTSVYLQEVGAYRPGTIRNSARQLEADMVVYTNIGVSHIDHYKTVDAIASDKLSLSEYGSPKGIAFINYDDDILRNHKFKQNVITYSLNNRKAMYYAKDITVTPDNGMSFTIVDRRSFRKYPAKIFMPGDHNVLNAVAAYAVGKALKLEPEEILSGISSYRPSGLRQNLIYTQGINVYADCYNSSLIAIESALNAVNDIELPAGSRKIAVLGDILGLDDISESTHREIAKLLFDHGIDIVLGYGIDIRYAIEEAQRLGMNAQFFESRSELEAAIRNVLKTDDIILFKASHSVNLGASIDRLFGTDINESSCMAHNQYTVKSFGDFEFYIFETSATLKAYNGTSSTVEIPAAIEASVEDKLHRITETKLLSVEKIGKTAFRDNQYIREVILPPTVVRIRDGAFKGSAITYFEGTDKLLSIGDEAFADCSELEKVLISKNTTELGEDIIQSSPKASLEYK